MTEQVEISVFNDKSYVRAKEYLKLKEENEQLKQQIDKLKEEKQYGTCPYRSTDMGWDYCDYRDRDLKDEVEE